jgi:hypothetical protein
MIIKSTPDNSLRGLSAASRRSDPSWILPLSSTSASSAPLTALGHREILIRIVSGGVYEEKI